MSDNSLRMTGVDLDGEPRKFAYYREAMHRLKLVQDRAEEAMRLLDEARMHADRARREAREYERMARLTDKQPITFPMANYYDLFNSLSERLDRMRGRAIEQYVVDEDAWYDNLTDADEDKEVE